MTGYHESKHRREAKKKRKKKGLLTQETIKPNHIVKSDLKKKREEKKREKKRKEKKNDCRKKSGDKGCLHNRPKFQDGAWWKTNKHGRGTHAKQTNARLTLNKNLS